jgi:hypothetical protein
MESNLPSSSSSSSSKSRSKKESVTDPSWIDRCCEPLSSLFNNFSLSTLFNYCFPDIPEEFDWHKRLRVLKTRKFGLYFDLFVVWGSMQLCLNYVAESYQSGYNAQQYFMVTEAFFTCVFIVDFLWSLYLHFHNVGDLYTIFFSFIRFSTCVDILTIVPVIISWFLHLTSATNIFQTLRFLRVFGLIRILKSFRRINVPFTVVTKQIIK